MKNAIIKIVSVVGFIALLVFCIDHEATSMKVSENGHYQGTIIDKTTSGGRSNTHYLRIRWDTGTTSSIQVHPMTYKNRHVGQRHATQLSYVPFFGAVGMAYTPPDKGYGFIYALSGFLAKILLVVLICFGGYVVYKEDFMSGGRRD